MKKQTMVLLMAGFTVVFLHGNARADICSAIAGAPGIYVKDNKGFKQKLNGTHTLAPSSNMWLWIIPDKPAPGLEVTWHVLVQTKLADSIVPSNSIVARRNVVVSACDGRRSNKLTGKDIDGENGIDLSYDEHNNNAGPGRPRSLPVSGGLRSWHFKWQNSKNDCPFTADHVEKAVDLDGQVVYGKLSASGGGALALIAPKDGKKAVKSNRYTTISSVLAHRNSDNDQDFCYSVPLRVPSGEAGETRIKVKRLKGAGTSTYTLKWDK